MPKRGLDRIDAPVFRRLGQGLAAHFVQGVGGQQYGVRTAATAQIVFHLHDDAAHLLGIVQPRDQRRLAVGLGPARQQGGAQARARRLPRILIGVDGHAFGLGGLDLGDDLGGGAVNVDAQGLDVGDVDGKLRLPADIQRLRHRSAEPHAVG
ncbi:hypothetical protein D3C77_409920 [compost metagenome]